MTKNAFVCLIWKQMLERLPYYTLFYKPAEFVWLAQHAGGNSAHLQVLATRRKGNNMPRLLGETIRAKSLLHSKPPRNK